MNGKSLMMLGLAVVFGLGAMLLTRQMLSQEPGRLRRIPRTSWSPPATSRRRSR